MGFLQYSYAWSISNQMIFLIKLINFSQFDQNTNTTRGKETVKHYNVNKRNGILNDHKNKQKASKTEE